MYTLVTTSYFDRRAAKFTRAHPQLKKPLAKVLSSLETDCMQSKGSWKSCTPPARLIHIASLSR